MCSLTSFVPEHSKLTISHSDTFKHLINVPRYISSSLSFEMDKYAYFKSTYSLMSRVTTSSNSVVTAVFNSVAYQQSPPTDK